MPPTFDHSALIDLFTHHVPTPDQQAHYQTIREAARAFAAVITAHTPASADQTVAIRKLREAVYSANASIALQGRF